MEGRIDVDALQYRDQVITILVEHRGRLEEDEAAHIVRALAFAIDVDGVPRVTGEQPVIAQRLVEDADEARRSGAGEDALARVLYRVADLIDSSGYSGLVAIDALH